MRVLDLFSGLGGFSLGLERAGMETVAFCEVNPRCRALLSRHWPHVPCFEDVTTLTGEQVRGVDVVCGGFPCQPFSTASRGRRVAIDLWPHMARLADELRPKIVIAENVDELPIRRAEAFLRDLGYRTDARRISAADCGADHQRDRWWVVAHPYAEGELHSAINAEVARLPTLCRDLWSAENYRRAVRVSDGVPGRMDRPAVEALGNAVIPQIPEAIGRAVLAVAQAEGTAA